MSKTYPFLNLGTVNEPYKALIKEAVDRVIESGRFIGGPEVAQFEAELAASCGSPYAVGVSNGLDALKLIFRALIECGRLAKGDKVLVPANTYIASILAVTDCGLVPVFVEPDPLTMNMDTQLIERHITPDVKSILTVHLYGRPCYDELMKKAAAEHNLIIVEDNAQAIGAESSVSSPAGGRVTGALGTAAAFSFYPTKNIGAIGDAGAITTSDSELANAVRALANYGSDRRYHNIYQGYNCRLDPIQAAILRVKLRHIDEENRRRRQIAHIYSANISNPLVITPDSDETAGNVWHQYVVRTSHRDAFREYLERNGVETDIHYAVPPHKQPCYAEFRNLSLPVTELLADEVVSLPVSACTSPQDAMEIAAIINKFKL
ncbi:MAG: DegT/DnrJ/EryC1/StrS family aminotransferase [Muribaculaceae bacterium]|nr:DegT/DnrJ/EryC1/StrS family aminotransferase [Muribaculaceae bacterium]